MTEARGLTNAEAAARRARFGPNEVREAPQRPLRRFLGKLWSPVPWMLEVSLLLEISLGHRTQSAIVLALLLFNAVLGYLQEDRARRAIELLRSRLTVRARALRDGAWCQLPAGELVPGDVVRLRVGDVTPADARLLDGGVLEDRAVVTGESLAVEQSAGAEVFAGTTIRRGEATAEVLRTGAASRYGRTAQLVETAGRAGQLEAVIVRLVRALAAADALVAAVILARAIAGGTPAEQVVPFTLMLLVASVPVALPATITLATALGSRELAERGVLVARLPAVEAAAALDVLCCDKTGTVTENRLTVHHLRPFAPATEADLLRLAGWASDRATQDPLDLALFAAADARGLDVDLQGRTAWVPFDPGTKRSEATVRTEHGEIRVIKGAPVAIAELLGPGGPEIDVAAWSEEGDRVLAVASGPPGALRLAGFVGFADPPRADSRDAVSRLRALGLRLLLVTGDSLATARAVAGQVGIDGDAFPSRALHGGDFDPTAAGVVAEVFPEDKLDIVSALQKSGHVVGMTGDGVNDAPALRQADVGVAVSTATDVARASAGMVLVTEGLSGIAHIVEVGREAYQRLLTYTINKVVKTLHTVLLLGGWYLFDGSFALTPRLIVLLLFANDFVTMSLATDRVRVPVRPQRWKVAPVVLEGLVIGAAWTAFTAAVLLSGRSELGLPLPRLQTLAFLTFVFSGQGTVYLIRSRHRPLGRRPSGWLALSSIGAVLAATLLAVRGWLTAPLPLWIVLVLAGATLAAWLLLDAAKVVVLALRERRAARTVPGRPGSNVLR